MIAVYEQNENEQKPIIHEMYETPTAEVPKIFEHEKNELMPVPRI